MQTFLDMKYYTLDDDLRLSNSLEKYLQEGENKPIPKKTLPEGTVVPPTTIDVNLSISETMSYYAPRPFHEFMRAFKSLILSNVAPMLRMERFSTLG